jgi:hypothetical protein
MTCTDGVEVGGSNTGAEILEQQYWSSNIEAKDKLQRDKFKQVTSLSKG